MPQNQLQTTTGLSSSLVRSLQSTKDDLLTPQWARERALASRGWAGDVYKRQVSDVVRAYGVSGGPYG